MAINMVRISFIRSTKRFGITSRSLPNSTDSQTHHWPIITVYCTNAFQYVYHQKCGGVVTPKEAEAKINQQRAEIIYEQQNLEERAISFVGRDVYEKLVKGYTEK